MKKVWFKAKNYGWGWYPSTWQGWLILLIYLIDFTLILIKIDTSDSAKNTLVGSFISIFILTMILLIICYLKGEPPEWRWGKN